METDIESHYLALWRLSNSDEETCWWDLSQWHLCGSHEECSVQAATSMWAWGICFCKIPCENWIFTCHYHSCSIERHWKHDLWKSLQLRLQWISTTNFPRLRLWYICAYVNRSHLRSLQQALDFAFAFCQAEGQSEMWMIPKAWKYGSMDRMEMNRTWVSKNRTFRDLLPAEVPCCSEQSCKSRL